MRLCAATANSRTPFCLPPCRCRGARRSFRLLLLDRFSLFRPPWNRKSPENWLMPSDAAATMMR